MTPTCSNSRYLLVKGFQETSNEDSSTENNSQTIPFVTLDPAHPATLNAKRIEIPDPSHKIDTLIKVRTHEYIEEENDPEDMAVFEYVPPPPAPAPLRKDASQREIIEISDDEDYRVPADRIPQNSFTSSKAKAKARPHDDWAHDPEWVADHVSHLMPPPVDASPSATMAVQRELKAMLKEQEGAGSFRELGWYMPPEFVGDNLFQWIVEMHSFDPALPIAKDLKTRYVTKGTKDMGRWKMGGLMNICFFSGT